MKRLFALFFCFFLPLFAAEHETIAQPTFEGKFDEFYPDLARNEVQQWSQYEFKGKHFFASYLECDRKALSDVEAVLASMEEAVIASGATLLSSAHYIFPPHGLTAVYLLSESHASIHTYPEAGACFVDLFTCGDHASSEKFDSLLRKFLKPKKVDAHLFIRGDETQKISCH